MAMNMRGPGRRLAVGVLTVLAMTVGSAVASAETLLMPKRDMLTGTQEVVWGITTLPNGTAYTIDFGDGTSTFGNVTDRSYIAFQKTYPLAGTYTVSMTVGGETATTEVRVYDPNSLSDFDERGVNINRAIASGLRHLWTTQFNRAAFDTTATARWQSFSSSGRDAAITALVVLAFMNHGYTVPNSNAPAEGIFPKYVVQRGLNFLFNDLFQQNLTVQTAGDPCVNVGSAAPCVGLTTGGEQGYETAVVALPIAASGALSRVVTGIPGTNNAGFVVNKTYGQVLQRIMNTMAWGQNDGAAPNGGGWIYSWSNNSAQQTDGSTVGWDLLALLDAAAAGINVAGFVKTEFSTKALPGALNNDGSFDYRGDNQPASPNSPNLAKAAIGLQGLFYAGEDTSDPRVQAGLNYISARWNSTALGQTFHCSNNSTTNKGCSYGMFNTFKALKLLGVQTLPGVNRPAGPGPIPANDWYADYVDWLLANQQAANTTAGGHWGNGFPLSFSCCESPSTHLTTAMAELILAPVALIQPDPGLFASVGLGPSQATNPPGTSHTVTAKAQSATGAPVPGATVNFQVVSGPNSGKNGQAVTDANGEAAFTYTDTSAPPHGTDTIQAFIGNLGSNQVLKHWVVAVTKCDADNDKDIDSNDLLVIRMATGQAAGPGDPRDGNGDGTINVADARYCQLRCTKPGCAP
jgi:hypothetical protein